MSVFDEEELYRQLYLLLFEQMRLSDSPDVVGYLQSVQQVLPFWESALPSAREPSDSNYQRFLKIFLSVGLCEDWKICQAVAFLMYNREREKTWLPEKRWQKIKYDFEHFLHQRDVCLQALELYREIWQKRQVEPEPSCRAEPPTDGSPSFDDLIRAKMARMMRAGFLVDEEATLKLVGEFGEAIDLTAHNMLNDAIRKSDAFVSDRETLALNTAFQREFGAMEKSLETPDAYEHDLQEPLRLHFYDLVPRFLGLLELEQIANGGNDRRLNRVISLLRHLTKP
ncbi:MAG: hypothetical protein WC516_00835 [Patescibacteria group bacterium]